MSKRSQGGQVPQPTPPPPAGARSQTVEEGWPPAPQSPSSVLCCGLCGRGEGGGAGWDWSHESLPGMCVGEQKLKRHSVNKMMLKFARRRKREKIPKKSLEERKGNHGRGEIFCPEFSILLPPLFLTRLQEAETEVIPFWGG